MFEMIIILTRKINHEIYESRNKINKKIRIFWRRGESGQRLNLEAGENMICMGCLFRAFQNYLLFRVCVVHPCCVFTDVCFVLFLFCLSTCMCVCLQFQGSIAGVPSCQALPGFPITAHHLCAFLL